MENINSIGIIIYTSENIEEPTHYNYINSKNKLESEACALNGPEILIDTKYKVSFIIENIRRKTYNMQANHIVNILKSEMFLQTLQKKNVILKFKWDT